MHAFGGFATDFCLTCTFAALEDSESKESELDAEEKETGLGEKADFATVS